jgi:phosphohistidine phosphatase
VELLVIRHARAEDREAFRATGRDDDLRPLTREGRRTMRQAARALPALVPSLDLVVSSPLVRAMETARIVARAYGELEIAALDALRPEHSPELFARWLAQQQPETAVAAVGHEPHLGRLVSYLLAGQSASFLDLKKGAACLVAFPAAVAPGAGLLRWSLTPAQLSALGGGR